MYIRSNRMKKLLLLSVVVFVLFSCVSFPEPEDDSDSLVIGSIVFDFPDGFFNDPPRTITNNFKLTLVNETTSKKLTVKTIKGYYYFVCKRTDKFILKTIEYVDPAPGPGPSIGMNFDMPITVKMHKILYFGQMKITFLQPEYVKTKYGTDFISNTWTFRKHEFDTENKTEEVKNYMACNDKEQRWQNHDIYYMLEK
jgi:hypothetical protein